MQHEDFQTISLGLTFNKNNYLAVAMEFSNVRSSKLFSMIHTLYSYIATIFKLSKEYFKAILHEL